jgi:hypothetical protein
MPGFSFGRDPDFVPLIRTACPGGQPARLGEKMCAWQLF